MKSILKLTLCAAFAMSACVAFAESTVYIFNPSCDSRTKFNLTINGADAGNFDTEVMAHHESNEADAKKLQARGIQVPIIPAWDELYPTYKKCVLSVEGPTIFILDSESIDPISGEPASYRMETTIDIEDGQTYYLAPMVATEDIAVKINTADLLKNSADLIAARENGSLSTQLMLITEKEAKKNLKNKKYHAVSEYAE